MAEDLNLTIKKPYVELGNLNLSASEIARRSWSLYCARQTSIITSLFSGQFHSCSQCAACGRMSSKYDTFSMLQVPVPKTEMRTVSLTISYSKGRIPVLCAIRIAADATLEDLHRALNELDPSFGLKGKRLILGVVSQSNVIREYMENSQERQGEKNRLSKIDLRDPDESFVVFVLPPEGEFMGSHLSAQYYQFHAPKELKLNQHVRLRLYDTEGHQLTGVVQKFHTDFCFDVACSDEQTRTVMMTDLVDGKQYMPSSGDYIAYRPYVINDLSID